MIRTYEEFLTGRGFSEYTIRARITFFRARIAEWGHSWTQLADHTIAGWLAQFTGWTRRTYHSHLSSIFGWMLETGRIDRDPMVRLRRPPMPRPRPRPLSEGELRAALEHATPRVRAFLLLGYLAGLRAQEIARIHGRDVDGGTLRVRGKGGTDEVLPLHPLLRELADDMPADGFWFPPLTRKVSPHIEAGTVTYHVGRLFRSLGIAGASHRARHTYGTKLLRGGANLRVVQELMRHRSLATTALYLGVDEDERIAAINALAA